MDTGFYAATTGLLARAQALDAAASNVANAQTPGYRAEREYFRSILLGRDQADSQLGEAVNQFGLLGGERLSPTQGPLERTGNQLDIGIEGEGFFAIQTANGLRFTRDGSFHRSQTGLLVTIANEPVLSRTKEAIQIPPGDVSISSSGVLSVRGGVAATVGVFRFPTGAHFRAEGANHYVAEENATVMPSTNAIVHQGAVEGANEDAVSSALDVMVMQRQAEMIQKTLTVFHAEFNKTACEELPRT
jgi:flagellar basal-body rod protein FlgF